MPEEDRKNLKTKIEVGQIVSLPCQVLSIVDGKTIIKIIIPDGIEIKEVKILNTDNGVKIYKLPADIFKPLKDS